MARPDATADKANGPTRRRFLQRGSLGALTCAVSGGFSMASAAAALQQQTEKKLRIVKAQIGEAIRFPNCSGDVWTTTWADDDNLYSVTDDTTGFDKACNSNLAVHRIMGGPPPKIQGLTVNPMTEFGKESELKGDQASWKASGLACVD